MEKNPFEIFVNEIKTAVVEGKQVTIVHQQAFPPIRTYPYFDFETGTVIHENPNLDVNEEIIERETIEHIEKVNVLRYNGWSDMDYYIHEFIVKYREAIEFILNSLSSLYGTATALSDIKGYKKKLTEALICVRTNRHTNLDFNLEEKLRSKDLSKLSEKNTKAYNAAIFQKRMGDMLCHQLDDLEELFASFDAHQIPDQREQLHLNTYDDKGNKYNVNHEDFKDAFHLLQTRDFIAKDTTLPDFRAVMRGEGKRKIQWIGSKEALVYFIKELFQPEGDRGNRPFLSDGQEIWPKLIYIFNGENGYDFKHTDTIRTATPLGKGKSTSAKAMKMKDELDIIIGLLYGCTEEE